MFFAAFFSDFRALAAHAGPVRCGLLAACVMCASVECRGQTVSKPEKHIIGATAMLTEASSGIPFAARVDTGAASCSLHVEKIEIKDEAKKPLDNIGKPIRFLVKNEKGKSAWIEIDDCRRRPRPVLGAERRRVRPPLQSAADSASGTTSARKCSSRSTIAPT